MKVRDPIIWQEVVWWALAAGAIGLAVYFIGQALGAF